MGCGSSDDVDPKWFKKFALFRFSESEVMQLKAKFEKMDIDKRGTVDVDEFVVTLQLESSKFTERVFEVFAGTSYAVQVLHYRQCIAVSLCSSIQ